MYLVNFDIKSIDLFLVVKDFGDKRVGSKCAFGLHGFTLFHELNFHFMFTIIRIWEMYGLFEDLPVYSTHRVGIQISKL